MNEDVIIPWLPQHSDIWMALLAGLAPAMIANFKRRSVMRWYLYGFASTVVAWPLVTLPTIHALFLRPRTMSPEARQRQRRADALALVAENSVQSYRTWIAELRRKSPEGVDRRRLSTKRSELATRLNSFAKLPMITINVLLRFGISVSTSAMCPDDIVGLPTLSTTGAGSLRS